MTHHQIYLAATFLEQFLFGCDFINGTVFARIVLRPFSDIPGLVGIHEELVP